MLMPSFTILLCSYVLMSRLIVTIAMQTPKCCLIPYQQRTKAEFVSHARMLGYSACYERSEWKASTLPSLFERWF